MKQKQRIYPIQKNYKYLAIIQQFWLVYHTKMHLFEVFITLTSLYCAVYCHVVSHPREILTRGTHEKEHDFFHANEKDEDRSLNEVDQENSIANGDSKCMPLISCPAHVRNKNNIYCETMAGRKGIYCSTGQNHTGILHSKGRGHHNFHADFLTLENLSQKSRAEMSRLRTKEANLLSKKSSVLQPGSATYGHFRNSRRFNPADITEVMHIADKALEIAIATRVFKDRQGITNERTGRGRIQQNLRQLLSDKIAFLYLPVL
ncbi:uncharacterized protein LOC115883259 [Sitophilus oryzae]|uniref:Uncharacterized protein LOC115883259 n=1 Tax=Sitophilus oryzae TaxID=7048 RepID=A0A6J2Y178_SITOR|nr:uncharacterized protein LOC115883259 [Sitophilus oryzae]